MRPVIVTLHDSTSGASAQILVSHGFNCFRFAAQHGGRPFRDITFDDVFCGLSFSDGWCTASIHDPASGCTLTQRFDAAFRECVVYTPPHREAICIEPYTCVPGCFELSLRGIDAGLTIVPPGGSFRAHVEISVA
jgi:aldose 1-epimerase